MENIPRFYLIQLADAYSVGELRKILKDAEMEEFTAKQFDEPMLGFWEQLSAVYKAAIGFRQHLDRIRREGIIARRPKHKAELDFQRIKDSIDIVEYIARYVKLRKQGKSFVGCCPFHYDKSPSFTVWPDIRGFKCFGCDVKGDIVTFRRLLDERGLA